MAAHFVVIGAGGLGCPALLGLRAAGAARIDIIDHDRVELGNLPRQVLFDHGDIGAPKAEVAAARLRTLGVDAHAHVERVAPEQLHDRIAALPSSAIVLDCTDAPAVKFACNDALIALARRGVIGAALALRGQAIAVAPGSACYRCVYEAPPPVELVPTCAEAGVLGPAVGTVGMFMAHLAVLLAGDAGHDAVGRLFVLELGLGQLRALSGRSRPDCRCASARVTATAAVTSESL
ncbi:MAG: HesA/MoeB/ThiF family protein [Deltaproteobacteria bacterium]|nr:HesA/MoeB/ThiF family protein [Deltaproteobacteria bacterium]